MPAKKKPGDSFRLPHRRHEYFNFFVPQPLGVVPMCESGRNILAKHKKMAAKKEKKQKPLEQVLMESCNKLRSNMSGINYMYFVMGLVFLKFASLKFEKRREELLNSEDAFAVDIPSFYAEKNVFYIPEQARWSLIKNNARSNKITLKVVEGGEAKDKDFTIGMLIDHALEELEKNNQQLKGALPIGTYAKVLAQVENFKRYEK